MEVNEDINAERKVIIFDGMDVVNRIDTKNEI